MKRETPSRSARLQRIPPARWEALREFLRIQKRYLLLSQSGSTAHSSPLCCCRAVRLQQLALPSSLAAASRLHSEAKLQNVPLLFSPPDDASQAFRHEFDPSHPRTGARRGQDGTSPPVLDGPGHRAAPR